MIFETRSHCSNGSQHLVWFLHLYTNKSQSTAPVQSPEVVVQAWECWRTGGRTDGWMDSTSRGVEWCFVVQAGMGVKSFFLAFNLSMDMSWTQNCVMAACGGWAFWKNSRPSTVSYWWTDGWTDRRTDGRYQVHYLPRFAVNKNFWLWSRVKSIYTRLYQVH